MANEKEFNSKALNRMRSYLPLAESIEILIGYAYQELKSRNEISCSYGIDEKSYHMSNKYLEDSIKKELKELSTEEIRDSLLPLIELYSKNAGRTGSNSCPRGLCTLAINQLKIESGDEVFDLGSGIGFFLADVLEYSHLNNFILKDLQGVEINRRSANVSKMLLSMLGANCFSVGVGNGLETFNNLYNKGFTFPPMGLRLPELTRKEEKSIFGEKFNPRNSVEWIFVDRVLSNLVGNNKRAVAILAPRALLNEADQSYRDSLIRAGMIESIIELPAGLLTGTTIKCCMVVFSEGNRKIKIVDASNVLGPNPTRFLYPALPVKEVVKLIDNAELVNCDDLIGSRTLMPSSLLVKNQMEPVKGVALSDLAEVFTGCQYTVRNFEEMFKDEVTGYRILTSSDINDGAVEWDKLQIIDYKETKFDKYAVKQNDVVITSKSSKVKICVVDIEPKEKILVTGGMIIVRPDIKKLNPTYLKIYLDSPNGQLALKTIQRGSTIITINAKDLGGVIIPEASLEKQENVAKKYNSKLTTLLALKEELKKIESSLINLYSEEFEEE